MNKLQTMLTFNSLKIWPPWSWASTGTGVTNMDINLVSLLIFVTLCKYSSECWPTLPIRRVSSVSSVTPVLPISSWWGLSLVSWWHSRPLIGLERVENTVCAHQLMSCINSEAHTFLASVTPECPMSHSHYPRLITLSAVSGLTVPVVTCHVSRCRHTGGPCAPSLHGEEENFTMLEQWGSVAQTLPVISWPLEDSRQIFSLSAWIIRQHFKR